MPLTGDIGVAHVELSRLQVKESSPHPEGARFLRQKIGTVRNITLMTNFGRKCFDLQSLGQGSPFRRLGVHHNPKESCNCLRLARLLAGPPRVNLASTCFSKGQKIVGSQAK